MIKLHYRFLWFLSIISILSVAYYLKVFLPGTIDRSKLLNAKMQQQQDKPLSNVTNDTSDYSPSKEFERDVSDKDFAIGGIQIFNSTISEVVSLYGEPLSKEIGVEAYHDASNQDIWHYQDFDLVISGTDIVQIQVFRGQYKTVRGIQIGDSVNKVMDRYGIYDEFTLSEHKKNKPGEDYYEYSWEGSYIGFAFKKRKVSMIHIYYST